MLTRPRITKHLDRRSSQARTEQNVPVCPSERTTLPDKKKGAIPIFQQSQAVIVHGTVQSSLFDLFKKRKIMQVVITEGRPDLEPLRVLCPELLKRKIQPVVITDNMAGFLFYKRWIKEIWIAYQTVEKDGCSGSIGSLILAVLGKRHNVPVYAYPAAKKLKYIGMPKDLLFFNGKRIAAQNIKTYVPLIEWVPMTYIKKIYG